MTPTPTGETVYTAADVHTAILAEVHSANLGGSWMKVGDDQRWTRPNCTREYLIRYANSKPADDVDVLDGMGGLQVATVIAGVSVVFKEKGVVV